MNSNLQSSGYQMNETIEFNLVTGAYLLDRQGYDNCNSSLIQNVE